MKIDMHLLLISFVLFVPVIVFNSHWAWISLPIIVVQFPLLTRWSDKRKHGGAINYLISNELIILALAIFGALMLLRKM